MSDENVKDQQDFPLTAVPMDRRKSLWSISVVLLGFTFFTGTMWAGSLLGPAFTFPELMMIIFIGNLLLGSYVSVLGYIAFHTGLTTTLLARYSFGDYGSRIVDLIFLFTQLGWAGWGIAMTSIVFGSLLGLQSTFWFVTFCIIFGIGFSVTAYIGYKGLEILSTIAVPAMTILIFVSIYLATRDAGGFSELLKIQPTATMSWGVAITIVFGTYVSGGTQSTNWSRWSKTSKVAVIASLLAFFIGNGLMILGGSYGALVYQEHDMVRVLAIQGLLFLGIILLLTNIWTSQDNTYYNFSVAACTFTRNPNRRLFVAGGAVVAVIIALVGIYNFLEPYLILAGTFIPPIGGILMADFFVKYKRKMPHIETVEFKKYNWAGLLAYVLGSLVAWFAPGITPINGIIAGFVLYPIFDWFFKVIRLPQENKVLIK
jgi:cytosine permease